MPKYRDPTTGQITEIGSPELNPELVAGKTLVSDTAPLGLGNAPITSSVLTPTPTIAYKQPNVPPVYPIAGLNVETAPLTPTAPETAATDLTKRLQALYDQNTGQTAYRASQEATQGIPALTQTQNDLSSKLKALQNEALAIPQQLQIESAGRGITTGGLAPLQTAALRTNAIQALGVSSLLEASRGNLATAMNLVDRAVSQKFDPIKEEIAAKMANLDLILKSPAYSLAQQNRAQAQKDIQDAKQREIERQEGNMKAAQAMAAAAVKLNPGNQAALIASQQVLGLDPNDPNYLSKVFAAVGQYQSDPTEAKKALDAHELAQANIEKIKTDTANAPLEREKMKEQIAQIKAATAKIWSDLANPPSDKKSGYEKATQFIADNPNASYADMKNTILQQTNLTATEADTLLASKGIVNKKDPPREIQSSIENANKVGFSRGQVEQKILEDNKFASVADIPAPIKKIVDDVYGVKVENKGSIWNPLNWFK